MTARGHVAAVITRLRTTVPASLRVLDSDAYRAAPPPFPYAVVYVGLPTRTAAQLSGLRSHRTMDVAVTACGESPDQARWCAEKVDDALVGWLPSLPGYVFWPVDQGYSQPVRLDVDVPERPTWFAALGYDVASRAVG